MDQQTRQWSMFIHLSVFAGYLIPMAGLVLPIILWQIKKEELPGVDAHGKMVTNFILSMIIYSVVSAVLMVVFIGFFMLIALSVVGIVFPIIGAIKANNGEFYQYPLVIPFFK